MSRFARPVEACGSFVANEKSFGMCRSCGCSLAEHFSAQEEQDEDGAQGTEIYNDEGEEVEMEMPPPPPPPPDGEDTLFAPSESQKTQAKRPAPATPQRQDKSSPRGACNNFTWNLKAESKNMCECGFAREQHAAQDRGISQRISKVVTQAAHRISSRFSLTKGKVILSEAQGVPCEAFQINLASDQYGLCHCGFNKLAHEKASQERGKLAVKDQRKREQDAKEQSKQPKQVCSDFNLDLANKEGYGYCKCGFRRDQHTDFKLKGEFQGQRKNLTAPKPFQ